MDKDAEIKALRELVDIQRKYIKRLEHERIGSGIKVGDRVMVSLESGSQWAGYYGRVTSINYGVIMEDDINTIKVHYKFVGYHVKKVQEDSNDICVDEEEG